MSKPSGTALLGRLAVHLKMISLEQLAAATREQSKGDPPLRLGEILVEKGFLTQKQLAKLVQAQEQVIAKQRSKAAGSAPAAAPAPVVAPAPGASELDRILREGIAKGASDVHFHSGVGVQVRVSGRLVAMGGPTLDAAAVERVILAALPGREAKVLAEHGDLDFCHEVAGAGRFRGNVYRQHRGLDAVFRFIPAEPPSLEQLGLPPSLARFTSYHQGLVLVTGPSGCGKSSTLAALVNLINEERSEHILTIEDPVEYVHRSKRCLVNQRSVHRHTESFARALRAALREDPDVIVIGELRDLETISLALTAAETGHLVLATLHTDNAIRTINRVIGSYPSDAQGQIRTMLSESLRAVVSQLLIPRADGNGRIAAIETLIVNKAVGNLIRENKTFQIQSILQTGAAQGMALLDASIRQHVQSGAIAREEALRHCAEPKNLSA
jgi:twitching motility protein PilT